MHIWARRQVELLTLDFQLIVGECVFQELRIDDRFSEFVATYRFINACI